MNEVDSSRKTVEDMLFYYLFGLIRSGVQDPKQVIATEVASMINLTEEQLDYIKINTQDISVVDFLIPKEKKKARGRPPPAVFI